MGNGIIQLPGGHNHSTIKLTRYVIPDYQAIVIDTFCHENIDSGALKPGLNTIVKVLSGCICFSRNNIVIVVV